jgi:hypothetical protein
MVRKENCCFIENVGGVDEDILSLAPTQMWSPLVSNVENVHVQFGNMTNIDVSKFVMRKNYSLDTSQSYVYLLGIFYCQ